jgi:CheY-like chemotaxis protein
VVDDEQDIVALFRLRFRAELRTGQVDFVFAHDGHEALRLFGIQPLQIVLILSDINMPGMSGFELLTRIKGLRPDVPVIMISAYGEDKQAMALELGADGFVSKPIDFQSLRSLILQEF